MALPVLALGRRDKNERLVTRTGGFANTSLREFETRAKRVVISVFRRASDGGVRVWGLLRQRVQEPPGGSHRSMSGRRHREGRCCQLDSLKGGLFGVGLNEEHSGRSHYRESLVEKRFLPPTTKPTADFPGATTPAARNRKPGAPPFRRRLVSGNR